MQPAVYYTLKFEHLQRKSVLWFYSQMFVVDKYRFN